MGIDYFLLSLMSVSSVCSDDDAAEGLLTSSQANIQNQVILNDCKSDKYDSCDESFSSIFQNIKSCKYLDLNSPCIHFKKNELFLLHLNMRSLQKNFDNLCNFLSKLPSKPHVISISETKIKDKPLLYVSIPGYTFLHNNSLSNAGGVGVYVADIFQLEELTFKATIHGCENIWIKITCPNSEINYVVGTVYRHPNSNYNAFCEYLNEILTDLNISKKYFFVLGDMNIDLSTDSYSTSSKANNYLNMLTSNCSASLINIPTRVTLSFATVLDHIITNENRHVIIPFVIDYDITDHYPVMAIINSNFMPTHPQPTLVRSYSNFISENFNEELLNKIEYFMPQLDTITENNINDRFSQFYSLITETINTHAPLKQLSRKQRRLKSKPWITKGLFISIKKKQKMHKTHYINGSPVAKSCYKMYSNTLTKVKELAKKLFYHQKLNECKDNPKKTWDILRTLLPSKKNSRVPNLIKINSTTTISDVHEITEEFNHHFVNVGKFIANSVQANSTDDEILYLKNACPDSIYLQPTTPYEIMTLINSLKLNKAGGHDDIDPYFLKIAAPILSYPLSVMLNHCLTYGIFPNKLKTAKVIPIFKKGSTDLLTLELPMGSIDPFHFVFSKINKTHIT